MCLQEFPGIVLVVPTDDMSLEERIIYGTNGCKICVHLVNTCHFVY